MNLHYESDAAADEAFPDDDAGEPIAVWTLDELDRSIDLDSLRCAWTRGDDTRD